MVGCAEPDQFWGRDTVADKDLMQQVYLALTYFDITLRCARTQAGIDEVLYASLVCAPTMIRFHLQRPRPGRDPRRASHRLERTREPVIQAARLIATVDLVTSPA